ncbi:hypothetical protein NQ317_003733 [Molorchus minor]|uniref:Alcohol dehydrogenase n=1 Tax=Molorchus minor TaxID=1323400 RepID=A0ABQ9IQK2_9CUCU|nr:hypothetical protein NQ317_003733 [Molorchus minor]
MSFMEKNYVESNDAFKKTIEQFRNIDILINNAGIMHDAKYELEVAVNLNSVLHGMILGLDKYLPKYKQTSEAVIVNISSICGVQGFSNIPVYCATKWAVLGLTKSWGQPFHYERTNVRVVVIHPGLTQTPLIENFNGKLWGNRMKLFLSKLLKTGLFKNHVAKELVKVIRCAPNGTAWIIEGGERGYEYSPPDRTTIVRKYIPE